jgi:hypothetical protein
VKLNINSVEVHPQLRHPVDGALVGAGSHWLGGGGVGGLGGDGGG